MAKFYGKIGFAITKEITTEEHPNGTGDWVEEIVERYYYGDVTAIRRRLQSSDKINRDVIMSNDISILADPFINDNLSAIRYITYMNAKWSIDNVTVDYPRLTLSLGGLYNEG